MVCFKDLRPVNASTYCLATIAGVCLLALSIAYLTLLSNISGLSAILFSNSTIFAVLSVKKTSSSEKYLGENKRNFSDLRCFLYISTIV